MAPSPSLRPHITHLEQSGGGRCTATCLSIPLDPFRLGPCAAVWLLGHLEKDRSKNQGWARNAEPLFLHPKKDSREARGSPVHPPKAAPRSPGGPRRGLRGRDCRASQGLISQWPLQRGASLAQLEGVGVCPAGSLQVQLRFLADLRAGEGLGSIFRPSAH